MMTTPPLNPWRMFEPPEPRFPDPNTPEGKRFWETMDKAQRGNLTKPLGGDVKKLKGER